MKKLAATGPSALRRATFALLAICLSVTLPPPAASAATLPSGFTESVVFSGLTFPTAVRFSPDGRVFVAEKSGLVKVFDSLSDPTPDIFADLRTNVFNGWDRGLLAWPSIPRSRPTRTSTSSTPTTTSSAIPPRPRAGAP